MSYKWDNELIKKFLTLYRKHKCLWNPYSPSYRNCNAKNEAFKIVVQELNVPRIRISDCLQQIEVIREKHFAKFWVDMAKRFRYKEEQLKAEKELKSGQVYTSKLPWFNLMSEMLCEVINDEENFKEDPATYIPCKITSDQQNEDLWTTIAFGGSPNFQYKPVKYGSKPSRNNLKSCFTWEEKLEHIDSGWKKPPDGQSQVDNSPRGVEKFNDVSDPWNKCPSCGWETEKNHEKPNNVTTQLKDCEKRDVQIIPEAEVPLRIERTQILNTNNRIEEANQPSPSPLCINESNYLNCKVKTPEADVLMQNRKKVQISSAIERSQESREHISTQSKKCNVTEDRTPCRDANESRKPHEVIILKESDARYTQSTNEFEKGVVMCPCRVDDIDQGQFSKNQVSHFEENRTNHRVDEPTPELVLCKDSFARQSQKISELENRAKFPTTSEEDKYEVCSRFKIVIPSSDRDDQNVEITGYEIRTMSPQLSKYILHPSSEMSKRAIGNADCLCKNELSVPNRVANVDTARYDSIIKLDINHKRSRKSQARKRTYSSSTMYTRQETADPMNDSFCEIEAQHNSFSNKGTQTDGDRENESMKTLGNKQTSKCNSPKTLRDQRCGANASLKNDNSSRATTLSANQNSIGQHQSVVNDDSVVSENTQIENSSLPAENFNHTKIFLNVIVKILESGDSHDRSEDLQTTLDTVLDRVKKMSMTPQNTVIKDNSFESRNATYNDTSTSTEYQSLIENLAPANRRAENVNPQTTAPKTMEINDTSIDLRSELVELGDTTYFRPESPILEARENEAANERLADGNSRNSGSPNERNESSMADKSTRSGRPASLVAGTNMSNFTADSFLDDTNEPSNEEPIASSSRRIREHRSPSELLTEFLEVIKYTMTMDGIPQRVENGSKLGSSENHTEVLYRFYDSRQQGLLR